jgi:hypothetical protein
MHDEVVHALRAEIHRAMGAFEQGMHRATDALSAAIARDASSTTYAPLPTITRHSAAFLVEVTELLDALFDRAHERLAEVLRPSRAATRQAQAALDLRRAELGQYLAGYVEGGALALAVYVSIPPELAAHPAQVSTVLAERAAFVPRRVEHALSGWLHELQVTLDEGRATRSVAPPSGRAKLSRA